MLRSLGVAAVLLVSLSASAKAAFQPLPPEKGGGDPSGLEALVVGYDGSTNGQMMVDVRNPTGAPIEFAAAGLYFVPVGNPDQSPQRLGAVGPYQVNKKTQERLAIPAGTTVRAHLDVYCIDSHRPSPSSSTPFRISRDRLPARITQSIDVEARKATASMGGLAAPAAKGTIQGTVWKTRDEKWIKLDGEGKQEVGK